MSGKKDLQATLPGLEPESLSPEEYRESEIRRRSAFGPGAPRVILDEYGDLCEVWNGLIGNFREKGLQGSLDPQGSAFLMNALRQNIEARNAVRARQVQEELEAARRDLMKARATFEQVRAGQSGSPDLSGSWDPSQNPADPPAAGAPPPPAPGPTSPPPASGGTGISFEPVPPPGTPPRRAF